MLRSRPLPRLLAVLALAAATLLAGRARAASGDLFVTSDASNLLRTYNGATGSFTGVFSASASPPSGQMAVHFGATNNRVLIGHSFSGVEERDATTGALIKVYNPGGSWQWAGIYAPTGEVYIGDMLTNDVRAYDATTGAFIRMVTPIYGPADMAIGPDGNLYICSFYGGFVLIVNAVTGAFIDQIVLPGSGQANDVAFSPSNGAIYVTDMGSNMGYRFHPVTHAITGTFVGTGWARPHGLAFSPYTGHLLAVDGVTGQVHEFDPVSLVELNPAFLTPAPGDKIVDLAFKPTGAPTPAVPSSWGRLKNLFH
jgi:DNA-binding beta-propeller fold protein YncE